MPADGSDGRPLKVFLNYRHADTQGTAWAIYMKLEQHFGHASVFFDHGALQPGMHWFDEIESQLAACSVFISLIGRQWMQILTAHQQRGAEDYVQKEIDLALRSRRSVTVIPVLVDEAVLPSADRLPLSLQTLPDCQAVRLRPTNLPDDIDALIARLDRGPPDSRTRGDSYGGAGAGSSARAAQRSRARHAAPWRGARPDG